jgi:preprotein translocase subunit Sec63
MEGVTVIIFKAILYILDKLFFALVFIIYGIPYFFYITFFQSEKVRAEKAEKNKAKKDKKQKTNIENAFTILGIPQNSDLKTIKSTYRTLAQKYHPDHHGDAKLFIKIQKAYEELTQ